ncbi:hypothetical protein KR009_000755, partial [Drosophila setifemur]
MLENFSDVIKDLCILFAVGLKPHQNFINDAKIICEAVQQQMVKDDAVFKKHMWNLDKTAAQVDTLHLDMPLTFQIFLPVRLPVPVKPIFNEQERTVKLNRPNFRHPFFYGNAANAKCMNLLLQKELMAAVEKIQGVVGCTGAIYDMKYTVWSYHEVPFVHQMVAVDRSKPKQRCIRFDFVLALEFDGSEQPLPTYFKAPISHRWFAYGMLSIEGGRDPADWSVLVPKWQMATASTCLRNLNMLIILHRLLRAQLCYSFALPMSIKLGFAMATEEYGEDYQHLGIAELLVSVRNSIIWAIIIIDLHLLSTPQTLGHQVFCNFCDVMGIQCIQGDQAANTRKLMRIRKQQMRTNGLFHLLSEALRMNCIAMEFIRALFRPVYIPLTASCDFDQLMATTSNNNTPVETESDAKGTPGYGARDTGKDTRRARRDKQFRACWQRKFTCQRQLGAGKKSELESRWGLQ